MTVKPSKITKLILVSIILTNTANAWLTFKDLGDAAMDILNAELLSPLRMVKDAFSLIPGLNKIGQQVPKLITIIPGATLIPGMKEALGTQQLAIEPTQQNFQDDCWKFCESATTKTQSCTGLTLCAGVLATQNETLSDIGNCNECKRQANNGQIKLNLDNSQIFLGDQDFFNQVTNNLGCLAGLFGGSCAPKDPPPPVYYPPPPGIYGPPQPEPVPGGDEEPEPEPEPVPEAVQITQFKPGNKVTLLRTLPGQNKPGTRVVITRHVTKARDPNACYGDDCFKTITGYRTTTRKYTVTMGMNRAVQVKANTAVVAFTSLQVKPNALGSDNSGSGSIPIAAAHAAPTQPGMVPEQGPPVAIPPQP